MNHLAYPEFLPQNRRAAVCVPFTMNRSWPVDAPCPVLPAYHFGACAVLCTWSKVLPVHLRRLANGGLVMKKIFLWASVILVCHFASDVARVPSSALRASSAPAAQDSTVVRSVSR